jgi:hypothetical protein
MKNLLLALLLLSWTAEASSASYSSPYLKKLDPVIVTVEFKDRGLANLHVAITLISHRQGEKKVYNSDEFQDMLTDLELEIPGLLVDVAVGKTGMGKDDLQKVKQEMDSVISKKIEEKKRVYFGDKEAKVGCRITEFFVTDIHTEVPDVGGRRGW